MKIFFNDPITGNEISVRLKHGQVIGRKSADIVIKDHKISTKHARVELKKGSFLIRDLGSTNGILFEGKPVDKILLNEGTLFQIGNVEFVSRSHDSQEVNLIELDSPAESETVKPPAEKHWSDVVANRFGDIMNVMDQELSDVYPMKKALKLALISGPQKGTEFRIMYGPRRIGNKDCDLFLFDWNIGDANFEIVEHDGSIYLTTDFPGLVLVNNTEGSTVKLSSGDQIKLGQSTMAVEISDVN